MGVETSLRIAVMPAAAPTSVGCAVDQVVRRAPHVEVGIVRSWGASADFAALRDGRFDAMVLVGPVDCHGLRASILTERERYAVVAADHPLAKTSVVRLEDVIDCPTFRRPEDVLPGWRSYWLNVDERGGEPRYLGRSTTELDALLAIGRGDVVGLAPDGWGRRPGLVTRLVSDLSPVPIVVVTRSDPPDRTVRTFLEALREHADVDLSLAERRVAAFVAEGYADHEIADRLVLSPRTVESHVANARRRLGLRSRAHLAARVAAEAIIAPTERSG